MVKFVVVCICHLDIMCLCMHKFERRVSAKVSYIQLAAQGGCILLGGWLQHTRKGGSRSVRRWPQLTR